MKHLALALSCVIIASSTTFAGFDIPRHVKKLSDLAEAKTEAASKGKGISIVYTDPGST